MRFTPRFDAVVEIPGTFATRTPQSKTVALTVELPVEPHCGVGKRGPQAVKLFESDEGKERQTKDVVCKGWSCGQSHGGVA